jgi:hypothetical protein
MRAWCGAALIHLSQNELQLGDVVLDSEAGCFGGFDADVDHHVAVARGQGRVVAGVEAVFDAHHLNLFIPAACTTVRRDLRPITWQKRPITWKKRPITWQKRPET